MFPAPVRQFIRFTSTAFRRAQISSAVPEHSFGVKARYVKRSPFVKLFIKHAVADEDEEPTGAHRRHREHRGGGALTGPHTC